MEITFSSAFRDLKKMIRLGKARIDRDFGQFWLSCGASDSDQQ